MQKNTALFLSLFLFFSFSAAFAQSNQLAITFDDLIFANELSLQHSVENTEKLMAVLKKNQVPVIGFVNESTLYKKPGEVDKRIGLLETWLANGHWIGNHTYSHPSFNVASLEEYKADFLKGEKVSKVLAKKYNSPLRYFRHPFLQTGSDSLKKYGFNRFLTEKGYQIAPVTLDNEDYIFNRVYQNAYRAGDKPKMEMVVNAYLTYLNELFDYSEKLAFLLEKRPIRHVFLCHINLLNCHHFDKVLALMKNRNYGFITLEEALKDPVYQREELYVGKGGFSWLHRWRITQKLAFKDPEPVIPEEIMRLYNLK
ncbi:polysaccharide deacetylase family protein [Runella sp.]|uniref:polysaccharide deacetylase family protein n=1 Tax=Runella sp. TaxID=1960881 RepID=UPI003D1085E8